MYIMIKWKVSFKMHFLPDLNQVTQDISEKYIMKSTYSMCTVSFLSCERFVSCSSRTVMKNISFRHVQHFVTCTIVFLHMFVQRQMACRTAGGLLVTEGIVSRREGTNLHDRRSHVKETG